MGTRHLICIFYRGEWVVAQYGQWDGYPEGQGFKLYRFLSVARNIDNLKAGLVHVYELGQEEAEEIAREINDWEEAQRRENRLTFSIDRKNFPYPSLSRDTGAKLLGIISEFGREKEEEEPSGVLSSARDGEEKKKAKKGGIPVQMSLDFANDPLFCEWAYVVDLDTNVLEVFSGGEMKTDGHRFKDVGPPDAPVPGFLVSIPFSEIFLMSSETEFLEKVNLAARQNEEEVEEVDEGDTTAAEESATGSTVEKVGVGGAK